MKSYYQSALILSLLFSGLLLIQATAISVLSLLYFSGRLHPEGFQVNGSRLSAVVAVVVLLLLATPGLLAFRNRNLHRKNRALWIQGIFLSLFIPVLPFSSSLPAPIFLLVFALAAAGFWILHVLIHGKRMESDSP